MVAKMIILAMCVAAVLGGAVFPAARYPAGVNPLACPNYPYCDNVALAANPAGWARSAWNVPAWTAYSAPWNGVWSGVIPGVTPVAARYPPGVDPVACPNYPYCH
ncbi:hypothetical protein J437_LFUL011003 [Ladona fulva]|uniref:Cuticle protein CPCFC domain-containing protein n=1 Tax=Ladona fulva TaxID=123851 RepID=A0A8K0KMA7_LADFU|nr:hypothetical protein J437_LFUL011003 [Ladona fulva]